jgi:hypothetical protein
MVTFFLNRLRSCVKSLIKHLSFINVITGVLSLLIIFLIKELGLAILILNILKDYIPNIPYNSEYIIASFIGLICRLGLKGLIEDGIKDIFPTYNPMTGAGPAPSDVNPTDTNNSGGIQQNTSGGSSSTSNPTGIQQEPSSDKDKTPEKTTNSTINKEGTSKNYVSKRYVELFDLHAQRISAEIKTLSAEISNCKDEEEKAFKMEDLDELFGQLTMLSKESAAETRKILTMDSQTNNKRIADSAVDQNSSKKRS